MSGPRSRLSIAWADDSASSRSPLRSSIILGGRPPAAVKAVSTHCMVFVHTAIGRCQQRHCHVQQRPVADPSKTCLPQALGERRLALASVTSRQLWRSVRDSNPRLPDSQSGALPTELTVTTSSSSESMFGTHRSEPAKVNRCAAGPDDVGTLLPRDAGGSRTHLDRTCSRPACRLAPASRYQRPRQESNLVYDLRKVVCGPAHSEDVLSFSSPLRNRTPSCRSEVCRAVHHTRRP